MTTERELNEQHDPMGEESYRELQEHYEEALQWVQYYNGSLDDGLGKAVEMLRHHAIATKDISLQNELKALELNRRQLKKHYGDTLLLREQLASAESKREFAKAREESAKQIEELSEERDKYLAGWQRAQADFDNLKRRSAQDVRDRVQQSQRAILLDLIELADDFERANNEAPADESDADDPWRAGVVMISQKLNALLAKQQVERIPTDGQPFDPELHEAVGSLPGRHDEIVGVVRTGYTVGQPERRVLRATQVMVGDGSVASTDAPSNETDATADSTDTDTNPETN